MPTDVVRDMEERPRFPKLRDRRKADRVLREAEHEGQQRDIAILQTLRLTGLSVREVVALMLRDIMPSGRTEDLTVRSGEGSTYRVVPLYLNVRWELEHYLAVQPQAAGDHLFISQRGEGIKAQAIWNVVKKYAQRAAHDGVSPHSLRHTFRKSALDAGVDRVTVAAMMGHDSIETTAISIYTQPSARDLKRAVERLQTE